jgi:hypothetical protein
MDNGWYGFALQKVLETDAHAAERVPAYDAVERAPLSGALAEAVAVNIDRPAIVLPGAWGQTRRV